MDRSSGDLKVKAHRGSSSSFGEAVAEAEQGGGPGGPGEDRGGTGATFVGGAVGALEDWDLVPVQSVAFDGVAVASESVSGNGVGAGLLGGQVDKAAGGAAA